MPNESQMKVDANAKADAVYRQIKTAKYPERELKKSTDSLRQELPTRAFYDVVSLLYNYFTRDDDAYIAKCADYLRMLYGGKRYDIYFKSDEPCGNQKKCEPKENPAPVTADEKTEVDVFDGLVNFTSVVDYVLETCVKYEDAKAIFDMLVELMDGVKDERWTNAKKKLRTRLKKLSTGVFIERVDELVMEKNVENEVQNVEAGGTGISFNKR